MTPAPVDDSVDTGFTLVELLVAMGLFLLLTTMIMSVVLSTSRATTDVQKFTNINEQARIATERLTRELRQASKIMSVTLPNAAGDVSFTFGVDFNGNGIIDVTAADPEVLTYSYTANPGRLTITANDPSGTAVTRPVLSEQVSAFTVNFQSSLWQYDGCRVGDAPGVPTGGKDVTDWTELDTICGGGNNDHLLNDTEIKRIDLVNITLTVLESPHQQTYQTQVGLRNLAQS